MDYHVFESLFVASGTHCSVAEAHGLATGMLCVDERADAANWLTELFDADADSDSSAFNKFFEATRASITSDDYRFDLLLPDDLDDLEEQVEALRDWCQGFLFGVGYSGGSGAWPGEISEILKDIVEITKIEAGQYSSADADQEDLDAKAEEDKAAFIEINEYLRASVYMIREEFLSRAESATH
ncbi:UPF0149 family protein [Methylicorpusculum oleiharenae]|uniref:UPF0149 family protein n=1 Tax=Methylicorpusculum oleiharenae TaxID=1338687 RepID=UPI001359C613|nr:UPF0149 family protein [Methylicorpusculum oleiharenae]MCD2450239.1 UPF0149 family protein [Methylicorpusculum oleiharenae]